MQKAIYGVLFQFHEDSREQGIKVIDEHMRSNGFVGVSDGFYIPAWQGVTLHDVVSTILTVQSVKEKMVPEYFLSGVKLLRISEITDALDLYEQ